jgi:hypothetical protein
MDEFDSINNRMPDLQSALMARMVTRNQEAVPNCKVDPYQVMMNRKNGVEPELPTVQQYPPEVIKQFEDYCKKMGIVGFSYGRMHPLAALRMLKQQLGDFQGDTPYEDRVEGGYQKLGTKESTIKPSRQIIHG